MAFCTNCGAELGDGVRFCTECGAPVEEPAGEPEEASVEEFAAEAVDESSDEPTYEAVDEPSDEPSFETVDEPTYEAVDEPVDEPADEPIVEPAGPRCPSCGAELEDGVRFCTNCGAPVDDPLHTTDGLDAIGETVYVEADATRVVPPVDPMQGAGGASPSSTNVGPATGSWQSPSSTGASTPLPPTMPTAYPEQPQPPAPRRQMGAGGIIGITLGIVAAVLVVGFGLFYFTNPFGLTDGIFANSAAAQAAAAEEAQAAADEAKAQAEQAQAEKEELQKQLDEANKSDGESSNTVVVVPSGGQSGGTSSRTENLGAEGRFITAPAGYPTVQVGNGGYVLGGSDYRRITNADIADMNDWELCVARNEIIARHGYSFKRDDLREFFYNLPWYSPDPNYSESEISELEWDNMNTILDLERARGSQYTD